MNKINYQTMLEEVKKIDNYILKLKLIRQQFDCSLKEAVKYLYKKNKKGDR